MDPRGDSRPYDHELASALAARGHDVQVISCRFGHGDVIPYGDAELVERFYGVADRTPRPFRKLARGAEHPLDMAGLVASLVRSKPDVVHVQWLPLAGIDRTVWRAARTMIGAPLIFTAHNALPRDASDRALRHAGRSARLFDRVVTHSEFGRRGLVDQLGVDAARVRLIPHGVFSGYADLDVVAPDLPSGVPVVSLLGLLRPYKGLEDLLTAWPHVRDRVPGAILHVAGRPLGEPAVERLATTQGVVADLRYISSAEFAGALQRSDVTVLPYRAADQSGVLFAAIALRRPVVVTDVGGLGEIVRGRGLGLVVPSRDPQALAEALVRVLDDRALRAQIGDRMLEAAEGDLSWPSIAEATEELYAGAILARR